MFRSLFRKNPARQQAERLYEAVVCAARLPAIFRDDGAPDTPEGRFEVLTVVMALAMRRLKSLGERALSEELVAVFFQNLDDQLREMGVGDLSVGKKIRRLAEAFYGRVQAYDAALQQTDDEALRGALARNVLASDAPAAATGLALRVRQYDQSLAGAALSALESRLVAFAAPTRSEGA